MKLNKTTVFVNRILDSFHSRVYFPKKKKYNFLLGNCLPLDPCPFKNTTSKQIKTKHMMTEVHIK